MTSRRSVVVIDKDDLEREWVEQADKFCEHAEEKAEADFDVDEAQAKLGVVKAEAEKDIRNRPKRYGLKTPPREAAVKLEVLLHARVQKYTRILNRKKLRTNLLAAVCRALEHRKRALEKLVDMGTGEQYAAPRTRNQDTQDRMLAKKLGQLGRKGADDDDD